MLYKFWWSTFKLNQLTYSTSWFVKKHASWNLSILFDLRRYFSTFFLVQEFKLHALGKVNLSKCMHLNGCFTCYRICTYPMCRSKNSKIGCLILNYSVVSIVLFCMYCFWCIICLLCSKLFYRYRYNTKIRII